MRDELRVLQDLKHERDPDIGPPGAYFEGFKRSIVELAKHTERKMHHFLVWNDTRTVD